MVIVSQIVTSFLEAQTFIDTWAPYAAKTYDPQTEMPTSGPFELRITDDLQAAKASCWLEPK